MAQPRGQTIAFFRLDGSPLADGTVSSALNQTVANFPRMRQGAGIRPNALLAAALACAAVALTGASAHASGDGTGPLDYAWYGSHLGDLDVYFGGATYPSWLDLDAILLLDCPGGGDCIDVLLLSGHRVVALEPGVMITIALSDGDQAALESMESPVIVLDGGSHEADGGESVAFRIIQDDQDAREALLAAAWATWEASLEVSGPESDRIVNATTSTPAAVQEDRPGPHPVTLLSRAAWDDRAGVLSLYFSGPVEPFSVDLGKIRLVNPYPYPRFDGRLVNLDPSPIFNTTLEEAGFERVESGPFQVAAVLKPGRDAPPGAGGTLMVEVEPGAYRGMTSGAANAAEEARVTANLVHVTTLESARYDIGAGELTLRFIGEIDPAGEVHTLRITPDGVINTRHMTIKSGGDPRSITYQGGILERDPRTAPDLLVSFYGTVYTSSYSSLPDGLGTAPLEMVRRDESGMLARPDYLMEHVRYEVDTNRLVIEFTEEIWPWSVYASRVLVYDDSGQFTLSVPEFVSVSPDRRSVTFELSESNRYALSLTAEPAVRIEKGAFSRYADRTEAGADRISLEVVGRHPLLLDPDLPTGLLVGHARYDGRAGEITLHFREAIGPSSIDAGRITLVGDHPCIGANLSDDDLVGVGADGKSATFRMDGFSRDLVQSSSKTTIRLEHGAFATEAGGTKNTAGDVPLIFLDKHAWYGSYPAEGSNIIREMPCQLTYAVESPVEMLEPYRLEPAVAAQYTKTVMLAVRDGFEVWSTPNPYLTFEMITDRAVADILVELVNYDGELGYGDYDCLSVQCRIGVVIVGPTYAGDNSHKLVGYEQIMWIVAHEFGHILGLGHHVSPDHLMFGGRPNDPLLQNPFDDLEYNVPDLGRWPGY